MIHITTGDQSFNCAPTQCHHQCLCYHIMNDMLECYLWASNYQPFDHWRAHHIYYVVSQPRTSDRLISHWRALCLLAHDNWRCSIQPEIFTHQNFARAGIRSRFDSGRVQCAYRYIIFNVSNVIIIIIMNDHVSSCINYFYYNCY